jgi:hypothetical protein
VPASRARSARADRGFLPDGQVRGPGPDRFPAGRVCAVDGCTTVLSVYNGDDRCAACDVAAVDRELAAGRLNLEELMGAKRR